MDIDTLQDEIDGMIDEGITYDYYGDIIESFFLDTTIDTEANGMHITAILDESIGDELEPLEQLLADFAHS